MGEGRDKAHTRDPERSREAILDAAEQLFSVKGYEETSLQEIGQRAGVSRGTPNYFFGSKEQLYGAVLDHVLEAEQQSVLQALVGLTDANSKPGAIFVEVIGSFLDFLVARPTFIRLVEREALSNARFLQERSAYVAVLKEGLDLIRAGLSDPHMRQVDPAQLLLSVIALCWFPLVHTETFLHPLGIEANDPAFWQSRKQHIIDLVLHGIIARQA